MLSARAYGGSRLLPAGAEEGEGGAESSRYYEVQSVSVSSERRSGLTFDCTTDRPMSLHPTYANAFLTHT